MFITTNSVDCKKQFVGIVVNEGIEGVMAVNDIGAQIKNIFGGRVRGYQYTLSSLREKVVNELIQKARERGANIIEGLHIEYESIEVKGAPMMMVCCYGTAFKISSDDYMELVNSHITKPSDKLEPSGINKHNI